LPQDDEPIHGAEIVRQDLAVWSDLERRVQRGSIGVVQGHVGMDAAPDRERAPVLAEGEALAPLRAPAAIEPLDE
jgi:hypothetical protein